MKMFRSPSLILLFFLLESCSPSLYNYIKISPAMGTGTWQQGREISEKTIKKVSVIVSFDKISEHDMVYDVTIINKSRTGILFDPVKVFCNGYFELPETEEGTQPAVDRPFSGDPDVILAVNDPEIMIRDLELKKGREKSSYDNAQMANDAACCIGATGSLTAGSNKKRREYEKIQEDAERDSRERENRHLLLMQKYNEQTAYYEKETLRKTTVLPGQTVRGKVHIPANVKVKLLVMNIPLENLQFDFLFGQIIDRPVRKQGARVEN